MHEMTDGWENSFSRPLDCQALRTLPNYLRLRACFLAMATCALAVSAFFLAVSACAEARRTNPNDPKRPARSAQQNTPKIPNIAKRFTHEILMCVRRASRERSSSRPIGPVGNARTCFLGATRARNSHV
jgi:hypothetical protein